MRRLFLAGGALVALDQATKSMFESQKAILSDFFAIKYSQNTGAAFGMLSGRNSLVAILNLAILLLVMHYYYTVRKSKQVLLKSGLVLLFAGAAGNLIDRLMLGYVRDFIAVWVWPTFNLADAFSTVGAALIAVHLLKEEYPGIKRKIKRLAP